MKWPLYLFSAGGAATASTVAVAGAGSARGAGGDGGAAAGGDGGDAAGGDGGAAAGCWCAELDAASLLEAIFRQCNEMVLVAGCVKQNARTKMVLCEDKSPANLILFRPLLSIERAGGQGECGWEDKGRDGSAREVAGMTLGRIGNTWQRPRCHPF